MLRGTRRYLIPAVLLLAPLGCSKLEAPEASGGKPIAVEPMPADPVIPRAWGKLVAVSPERTRNAFHLWFQDDSGTIHLVTFNSTTSRFSAHVGIIPRQ